MEVTNKQELIEYIENEVKAKKTYNIYPDTNNDGRRLETYDQFAKEFARCRDHKKGRKISAASDCSNMTQYNKVSHLMSSTLRGTAVNHSCV